MTPDIPTPELDRLLEVNDASQLIGEFLEWLQGERGFVIAQRVENRDDSWFDRWVPAAVTINGLLAEFYEIDLVKVEEERRALLEAIRGEGRRTD